MLVGEARARNGPGDSPFFYAQKRWGMDDQEEKIIERLTQRVQAELATAAELRRQNDLAEETLKTLKKTQQAEASRNRLWLGISEQTAALVQQMPEYVLLLHGFDEKLEEFGEQLRDLSDRLDRLEYASMLILSGNTKGSRARALVEDIEKDRKERLIEEHKRHLHELEIKRAGYGKLAAPVHLLTEIEDLKNEIEQLETEG